MNSEKMKRKLVAILSADVKGYSRLMSLDEEATVRKLTAYKEVVGNLIRQHGGRVVDAPGDNLLAEFTSVVDAVQCAVEIQKELRERNAGLPEDRRMEFRIGVNLGDVVEEGEKIFGDGVNVVARVEGLAEPGGVCISGTAYDQVKNRLPFEFKPLGEQVVKNIPEPVRVYRVLMEPGAAKGKKGLRVEAKGKRALALGILALLLVVASVAIWRLYIRPTPPPVEAASKERMAFPLPDKPSIAVLPFVNMSEDSKQEFFSDGITEEIISALSRVPGLFVIARNSTFTYKGKPVKMKQVSEELGVQYVVEGSVRKTGDRVRIAVQLLDALSGRHVWAERYDRDLKDILALQEEIAIKIITALQVKLTAGEMAHAFAKGVKNIDAYIKLLQSINLMTTKEGTAQAKRLLEEAVALDPDYPRLYTALAWTHISDVWFGTTESPQQSLARAFECTKKAISLDDSNATAYSVLGLVYGMKRQYDQAIVECERGVSLDPNSEHFEWLGAVLTWAGRAEEAVKYLEFAVRLNPLPTASSLNFLAVAYRDSGKYEKAIEASKKALQREPNYQFPYIHMTVSYIRLGREEEARAAAAEILRINPSFSLDRYAKILPFTKPVADRVVEDLRKAGLK
jgi:adenylate cyclase